MQASPRRVPLTSTSPVVQCQVALTLPFPARLNAPPSLISNSAFPKPLCLSISCFFFPNYQAKSTSSPPKPLLIAAFCCESTTTALPSTLIFNQVCTIMASCRQTHCLSASSLSCTVGHGHHHHHQLHTHFRYPLLLSSTARCRHRDATTPYLCRHGRRPQHSSHPSFDLTGAASKTAVQEMCCPACCAHTPYPTYRWRQVYFDIRSTHRGTHTIKTQSDFYFGFTVSVGNPGLLSSQRALLAVVPYTSFSLSRVDIYPAISVTRVLKLARPFITPPRLIISSANTRHLRTSQHRQNGPRGCCLPCQARRAGRALRGYVKSINARCRLTETLISSAVQRWSRT